MKGRIVLFGTCHTLQFGERSDSESHQFQDELKRVCRECEIELITEEASKDILDHKRSLASEVARDLGVRHEAFDLSRQERRMFKIEEGYLAAAAFKLYQDEDFDQLLKTLSQRLSNPIRECYWYACILDCCVGLDSPSTLFICGADHIDAMNNLIKSTGMKVVIAQRDYLPES